MSVDDMPPAYKILSIDGGGIRGVFPAAFLAKLEDHLDAPLASYFDLIAGTSTGGIIAIALGLGLTAKEILKLYEEQGPAIFDQQHGVVANFLLKGGTPAGRSLPDRRHRTRGRGVPTHRRTHPPRE